MGTIDRFSILPDLVIDHIFSYLGENDIVRITSLSRKFRHTCLTSLALDFELDCPSFGGCICKDFCCSVTNILSKRNGNRLQRLRIFWDNGKYCRYDDDSADNLMDLWSRYAVDCQVQVLDLSVCRGNSERDTLFQNIEGIKELKFYLPGRHISLPQSIFSCLVSLTLIGVEIAKTSEEGVFGDCFSNIFMNLKMLCLGHVGGITKISISSSSLEEFSISQWGLDESGPYTLKLDSPSIKEIVVFDCCFEDPINLDINCSCLKALGITACKFLSSCKFVLHAKNLEILGLEIAFKLQELEDPDMTTDPPIFRFTEDLLFLKYAIVRIQALDPNGYFLRNYDSVLVLEDENPVNMNADLGEKLRSPSGWLYWLEHLSCTTYLEIDILPELFRYDCNSVNFRKLQHLVLTFVRFGGDEDVTISPFLNNLVCLRTLTLELDEDSIPICDTNVLYIMCIRAENYVANGRAAKTVVFSLEDNDLEIDPGEDNSGLLEEILNYECAFLNVTFFFGEETVRGIKNWNKREKDKNEDNMSTHSWVRVYARHNPNLLP